MIIWMAYIKQIYTAFIRVSGLKLWSLGDCNIVLFCFGAAPLSKIAQYCSHLGPLVLTRASHGRIYLYTFTIYHFVILKRRSKVKFFSSAGVKQVKMLQFYWQWSQNVCLVDTIQIQNSLLYVTCFVTMVMQWESLSPLADLLCCATRVTKHLTYDKLFWFLIVFLPFEFAPVYKLFCDPNFLKRYFELFGTFYGKPVYFG